MLDRFIKQGRVITDKNGIKRPLNENDDLPQALTDLEVAKVVQQANTLFGYMDNDNKSEIFKQGMFTIIGHFKTFVTAKKNQYLLTRDVYMDGKFVHKTNDKGEKLYHEYDEDGVLINTGTKVTDNPYIE